MSLPYFKKSNFTCTLALLQKFISGLRILLDPDEGLRISSDNPFDFYAEICSLLPIFLKDL